MGRGPRSPTQSVGRIVDNLPELVKKGVSPLTSEAQRGHGNSVKAGTRRCPLTTRNQIVDNPADDERGDVKVAVLGLGEAGARYAADLATAGWQVASFDPQEGVATPPGVRRAPDIADAISQAELVLSLTGGSAALHVSISAAPFLAAGSCYADMNTTAPDIKRDVAAALVSSGAAVADVAVLSAVPSYGVRTPLMASGPGAVAVAGALRSAGAPVEVLDGQVGQAAGRKLLRSIFMKGLASLTLEALAAGRAAGCEPWLREQIAGELGNQGQAKVDRLIHGSRLHAERRLHEMHAARRTLDEYGVPAHMCDGAIAWLELARSKTAAAE